MTTTPNHALRRTRLRVTPCAANRHHLSIHRHRPRRSGVSLSLRSVRRRYASRLMKAKKTTEWIPMLLPVTHPIRTYIGESLVYYPRSAASVPTASDSILASPKTLAWTATMPLSSSRASHASSAWTCHPFAGTRTSDRKAAIRLRCFFHLSGVGVESAEQLLSSSSSLPHKHATGISTTTHMQLATPATPPQKLELRSLDYERFTQAVNRESSIQNRPQFLLPLLPAQRGWGANQALQRTRLRVTVPASPATFPPTMQVPRRSGVSLSLRSLGRTTRYAG